MDDNARLKKVSVVIPERNYSLQHSDAVKLSDCWVCQGLPGNGNGERGLSAALEGWETRMCYQGHAERNVPQTHNLLSSHTIHQPPTAGLPQSAWPESVICDAASGGGKATASAKSDPQRAVMRNLGTPSAAVEPRQSGPKKKGIRSSVARTTGTYCLTSP